MKKHEGFTLVELLVALGLFSIIFSLIMNFYIANIKNFKSINDDTELQFQAQYILNFMCNKILESKYVELIRENTKSYLTKSSEQKITKISFRYGLDANKCYIFESRNNKIFYGNGYAFNNANIELGNYVSTMYASPVPNGVLFENAEAIKIRLEFVKGNQSFEAEQIIFMRNN